MRFRFWQQWVTSRRPARRRRPAMQLNLESLEDRTLLSGGTPLPVAPSTLGLWHLDEGGGSVTADAAGANTGSLVNGPQWVSGNLGNALHFNGAGQYARVKQGAVLGSAPNFTVEAWVKWDGGGSAGAQLIYCEGSFNDIIDLYLADGKPAFTTLGANWFTATAPAALPAGEWHFLAAVLQAGVGGSLYVDGQLAATNASMGAGSQFAGETDIGRFAGNGGSRYFRGTIDEVRVRTVAMTAAQILADYQQTAGAVPTATATTVSGPGTALAGYTVTFTASVAPAGAGTPTGTVTFVDATSGATLGSQPLSGGSASVSTAGLAVGTHTITASYSGDASFSASSGSTAVSVNSLPSATGATPLAAIPGTAGLWHLDEGAGGTTADASGVNGPGVLVNGPQWAPGTLGGALHFDGATQYVRVKQGAVLGSAPNFTVEAWVKWDGGGAPGHQFIYSEGSFNDIIDLYLSNGVPSFTTLGANWFTASAAAPLPAGEWHFLAGVLQAGVGGTLYVDGVPVATNPNMGAGSQFAGETDIGRFAGNGGSRYFRGTIDEVRVRTAAQSAAQILADYQQTRGTNPVTLTTVSVTPGAPTLAVGQTQEFTATGTFSDGTSRPLTSGGGAWADDTAMPTARHYPAAAVINGILYVVGGNSNSVTNLTTLEAYDPATHTWTTKAPLPTARHGLAVAVVDGILYALGGSGNNVPVLATVEAYDPATNTWTTKAPMSTPRTYFGAAVVDGVIYAVGGSPTGVTPLASVEAYDPRTNTWTAKAPLNTARWAVSVANLGGTLYAVGGRVGSSNVATVEAYHPATNTWTVKAPLPTTWGLPALGVVNGTLYAVGGDVNELPSAAVRRYDPATDTWLAATALPAPREALAAGVVNGVLYAVGGWDGTTSVATVQAYTPTDNLTWASSDPHVAAVDAAGLATIVGTGPVTITATAGGVSGGVQFTVAGKAVTTTAVGAPPAAPAWGQAVTFTATVSAAGGIAPAGTVSFLDATTGTDLGTAALVNGSASVTTSALHAGLHNIVATYGGSPTCEASSGSVTQQVNPADQTIALDPPAGHAYGDGPFALTAAASSGLPVQFTVLSGPATVSGNVVTLTGAGTVVIEATQPGGGDYHAAAPVDLSFTATPAPLTVTALDASRAYGEPNPAFAVGYSGFVNGDSPGALGGALGFTTAATAASDVGGYQVVPGGLASPNYTITYAPGLLSVTRADQQIAWATPAAVAYGTALGAAQLDAAVSVVGPAPAGALSYDHAPGEILDAGTYMLTVTAAATNDYNAATAQVTLVVQRATATVVVTPVSLQFDGQPHGTTAEAYGIGGADLGPAAVSYSTSGGTAPVHAGTYTATGTFPGNNNYAPAGGTAAVIIGRATPTVVVYLLTVTYDGQPHGTTGEVFGVGNADLGPATVSYLGDQVPVNAGTYAANGSFGGNDDYVPAVSLGLVTINQATPTVIVTPVSVTYNGQPHGTTATVYGVNNTVLGPAAISYSSGGAPVHAGTYTATGSFAGETNYTGATGAAAVTITPAALTVTADSQTKVYGAPLPPLTASYSGLAAGDTPASLNPTPVLSTPATAGSPVAGGPYAITVGGAASPDYLITYVSGTLTVTPAGTAAAVASSLNPALTGQDVTFTATVSVTAPGAGVPTGSVTFTDGGTPLATVPLQWVDGAAVATFTTSALPAGGHAIAAAYAGDGNFNPAAAPVLTQAVQTPQQALLGLVSNQIPALVSSGVLSAAQANALTATLNNAIARFAADNPQAAANQLNAFINKVNALKQSGRLSDADAESLLDVAVLVLLLLP